MTGLRHPVVRAEAQSADPLRDRRAAGADDDPEAGELEIRRDQFQTFAAGRSVDLTRREFELIALLSDLGGQVIPREEIYERVWGYAMARGDRSVDVFVRKLRQKLEKASPGWHYIHTHFGVGYRFAPERIDGDGPAVETPRVLSEQVTSAV